LIALPETGTLESSRYLPLMPSIKERVDKIFETRRITRTDQAFLMSVFASGSISEADEALINKIYDALSAGRLRVVD